MPRSADPAMRDKLLTAAADVLATDGPKALTTRRLASEAGTSTMVVYTYFGSMDQLRRDLRYHGFRQLCDALDAIPHTDDAVADLAAAVGSYVGLAVENPAQYRVLFVDLPPAHDDLAGAGVHERLLELVDRCARSGRFAEPEPVVADMWAAEVWLAAHGIANLAQSKLLSAAPVAFLLSDLLFRLVLGFGDHPERARASIERGVGAPPASPPEIGPSAANAGAERPGR